MAKRRGFTLIELLVVIAIIGILAAMLFPVFARARESARKIQCLSNIKNIAMAMQMYLTDYDRTPPKETRQEVIDYFLGHPGGATSQYPNSTYPPCIWMSNPYLRWQVILDEYIKNRDIWRCPSAKLSTQPQAIIAGPDWLRTIQAGVDAGVFGYGKAVCFTDMTFPPGWGGGVTDSLKQEAEAGEKAFSMGSPGSGDIFTASVAVNAVQGLSTSSMDDVSKFIVVGDGGPWMENMSPGLLAYPDCCAMECGNCWGWVDWEACASWAADCGMYSMAPKDGSVLGDPNMRKRYARHLDGVNVGFMDGHAKWYSSEALVSDFAAEARKNGTEKSWAAGMGLSMWGPWSTYYCGWGTTFKENSGGEATLW